MAIKTFDANRVGGGTFSLEQDATTGEYKLKEVGFVKLPELKLPEIDQAAYTTTTPTTTTPTTPTPGQGTGTPTSGGGDRDNEQLDYTGAKQFENIQEEATKFSKQDTGIDRTDINQGAIQVEGLREKEAYDKAVANYNAIAEKNRDFAMGKQSLSTEDRLQNKADIDAARNQMDSARQNYEGTFETIKAAPKIGDFSQGPKTVPTGTLTGAKTTASEKIPDRIMQRTSEFGSLSIPKDKNIIDKAQDLISNSATVKVIGATAKIASSALDRVFGVSPAQREYQNSTATVLKNSGYKTRGELGASTDPGRIAISSADSVFGDMNRAGDTIAGANKRISVRSTVGIQRVESKYGKNSQRAKDFRQKTENFKNELEKEQAKVNKATMNQGPPSQSSGGGDSGCFIKGTLITMFDGSKKPVEKVDLGDNVAIGGNVFAVGKFLNTELYDYKGIKVSGSHMVNENGTWIRVRDTKHGKSLGDDLNTVYVFGSENRRILIDNILFTDYFEVSEQDQLINNEEDFFNNWKSYGNNINEHNVNTLNAS